MLNKPQFNTGASPKSVTKQLFFLCFFLELGFFAASQRFYSPQNSQIYIKINSFIRFLEPHSIGPQAKTLHVMFSHSKIMFSVEKSMKIHQYFRLRRHRINPSSYLVTCSSGAKILALAEILTQNLSPALSCAKNV